MNNQNNGPRFGCPQCGSERIDERNLVPFHYPVTAWTEDGEPADYGERREIEAGTEIEETPYWCNDCHNAFWRPVRRDVDPDADVPGDRPALRVPELQEREYHGR